MVFQEEGVYLLLKGLVSVQSSMGKESGGLYVRPNHLLSVEFKLV